MTQKFEYTILDFIESASKVAKVQPLNLGGVGGAGGGAGVPPGGYIGQLPQYKVAYDTLEAATLSTLPSGLVGISGWSLVDNLNHIRYRLQVVESGISVVGSGGLDTTAGDARYLKLDTSNDPLTDQLDIVVDTPGNGGIYLQTEGDSYTLDIEQYNSTQNSASSPTVFVYRENTNSKSNSAYLLDLWEAVSTGGTITGGVVRVRSKGNDRLIYNPNIVSSGATSFFVDTNTTMTSLGKILSLRNTGNEKFSVTGDGTVNIPAGSTYNINDIPHTHGVTPAYTVTNVTTTRTFDANSTSIDELADVLGTLIQDLKDLGIVG